MSGDLAIPAVLGLQCLNGELQLRVAIKPDATAAEAMAFAHFLSAIPALHRLQPRPFERRVIPCQADEIVAELERLGIRRHFEPVWVPVAEPPPRRPGLLARALGWV